MTERKTILRGILGTGGLGGCPRRRLGSAVPEYYTVLPQLKDLAIPSRQITKIQITTNHSIYICVINQASMYFSVRSETTRSQLFIMTSHTGIKPSCLFKLIPHKAFSLSDNLHIDLEHSQVFKVYCTFKAFHSYYSIKSTSIYI